MTTRLPAAVLWDMDGTLVDTEPYWIAAETVMVESFGGTWTHEDALQLVGAGLWESAAVFQRYGVELDADTIVHRLTQEVRAHLASNGVPWRPGAKELLEAVRDAGIPTALVTMSVRAMAQDVVDAIPFPAFDLLVTGDEVDQPKPHPEPYLSAAQRLGVPIGDCIAIEDSPAGLASATTAGAVAIGVPNVLALDAAPHHVLWSSLADRGLDHLAAAFAVARPRSSEPGVTA